LVPGVAALQPSSAAPVVGVDGGVGEVEQDGLGAVLRARVAFLAHPAGETSWVEPEELLDGARQGEHAIAGEQAVRVVVVVDVHVAVGARQGAVAGRVVGVEGVEIGGASRSVA
jgi:hypothetical protein